jgi:AcrR family transcriptional regulator
MKTDKRSPKPAGAAMPPAREDRVRQRQALRRTASDVYRAAILQAAEKVFGQRSFDDAKIADVARESGIASGTLYNYFDGKEAIFRSLIDKLGDELLGRLKPIAGRAGDPLDRLRSMVEAILEHIEEHRQMFLVLTELGPLAELGFARVAAESAGRVHKACLRHFETVVKEAVFVGKVRDDHPPADLTHVLLGIVNGQVKAWLIAGGRKGLVGKAATSIDLFVRGAGAVR